MMAQTETLIGMGEVRGFTLYTIYDNVTGRIVKYGQARDTLEDGGASMAQQAGAGQSALAVSAWPNPATMYVPGGVLTPRLPTPIAASVAGRVLTLTGVPSGATWSIIGATPMAGVADASGRMVITFAMAGTYTINVTCFPAQDFSQQVILT